MILTESKGVVLTSGDMAPSQFRIKASRKAFEILSSGLYSDKVRAIIRELSTNAADAHVAAGKKDVPFEVHLPNNLEPWFAVTDFGTGLSDDAINTVYTTYFESDKTDSNEYTGCLGLGSKSPFSYTDSFTVESRHNGTKRIYNAYLSEDGLPSIAKLHEEATDEPNGLTVKFPVKGGDFYDFNEKAQLVLRWFKTRPTVKGARNFTLPTREYLLSTDKFAVLKSKDWNGSYAVMGNVAYPIGSSDFLNTYDAETQKLKALLDWGVELYVNVGDVDIAASREKLGYDKRTIRFLKTAIAEALDVMGKEVTKEIANKPTLWEARKALSVVRNSFKGFDFKAIWGGNEIEHFVKVTKKETTVADETSLGGTKTIHKPVALVERLRIKSHSGDRLVVKKEQSDSVFADGSTIFLNDERGGYAAVRRYLEGKSWDTSVYLISEYDQEWVDKNGISEVAIKTSTLPKPERVKGVRGATTKAKLYEFRPQGDADNGTSASAAYWQAAEVDPDDGGVYVEILYFNYRMKDGEATAFPGDLNRPLSLLKTLGKDVKVYGIRPADKATLDKSEGDWVTLKDFALDVLKDQDELHADFIKGKEMDAVNGGGSSYYRTSRVPFKEFKDVKFDSESQFGQFVTRAVDASRAQNDNKVKAYGELRAWAGIFLSDDVPLDGLEKAQEALYDRYPMLRYTDPYRTGDDFNRHVTQYVNLIDMNEEKAEAKAEAA